MTNEKDTAENFDTNAEAENEQKIADQHAAINGNAASAIMGNPAAAAGLTAGVTPEVLVQRTLAALPGLVGAIDHAIKDQTGKHQPFVLLIFAEGTALHSANFQPDVAKAAVIELAQRWGEGEPSHLVPPGEEGAAGAEAANEGKGPGGVTH